MKQLGILLFVGGMILAICCGAKLTDDVRAGADSGLEASRKAALKARQDFDAALQAEGDKTKKKSSSKDGQNKNAEDKKAENKKAVAEDPKAAKEKQTYPSSAPYFGLFSLMSLVGLYIWRFEISKHKADLSQAPDEQNPVALLKNMQPDLQELQKQIASHSKDSAEGFCEFLCQRIEKIVDTYVFPLNQVRGVIMEHFGMTHGAEVLVTFSGAERLLNRALSAAMDICPDEAIESYSAAVQAFADTDRAIQSAKGFGA